MLNIISIKHTPFTIFLRITKWILTVALILCVFTSFIPPKEHYDTPDGIRQSRAYSMAKNAIHTLIEEQRIFPSKEVININSISWIYSTSYISETCFFKIDYDNKGVNCIKYYESYNGPGLVYYENIPIKTITLSSKEISEDEYYKQQGALFDLETTYNSYASSIILLDTLSNSIFNYS